MASSSRDITGAAFICLQEVLHIQLYDILLGLNGIEPSIPGLSSKTLPEGPIWAHIGVAREDGQRKGEYSPILYPVRTFKLLYFENTWLSPTPDRPSKGWDASSMRILTLGVFEHRATGKLVIACCTHLDNVGGESREKGVGIILDKIQHIRETWRRDSTCNNTNANGQDNSNIPVFLAGDFNSFPDQEAYLAMQDSNLMCDLCNHVEPKKRYGEEITFTGFEPEKDKDEQGRIDFIWLGPKEVVVGSGDPPSVDEKTAGDKKDFVWRVDGYAVLPNLFADNVYSSDHRCVVGDVSLHLRG
jgi:endonuclease/exonuclease/phosphatase family metal-dependent hydrolase